MTLATASATQSPAALVDEQRRHLFPCVTPYYREPLVLESASGVWARHAAVRDRPVFLAGLLITSVAHFHPEVIEAISAQPRTLSHFSTLYLSEPQVEAARLLAEIAPGQLSSTFFTNSGTEAIETAVMLACLHTGRSEILTPRIAYSGR